MQNYVYSFILYLILTVLVESIVVFLLLRKLFRIKKELLSNSEIVLATIFASSLTLPYVWFVFPYLFSNFALAVGISEVFALVIEAIFYKVFLKLSFKNAFIVSFLANLVSFGLGRLLHYLFAGS